jgi:hypothetical protein
MMHPWQYAPSAEWDNPLDSDPVLLHWDHDALLCDDGGRALLLTRPTANWETPAPAPAFRWVPIKRKPKAEPEPKPERPRMSPAAALAWIQHRIILDTLKWEAQ